MPRRNCTNLSSTSRNSRSTWSHSTKISTMSSLRELMPSCYRRIPSFFNLSITRSLTSSSKSISIPLKSQNWHLCRGLKILKGYFSCRIILSSQQYTRQTRSGLYLKKSTSHQKWIRFRCSSTKIKREDSRLPTLYDLIVNLQTTGSNSIFFSD